MPLGALGTTLVVGQLLDKNDLKIHFGKDRFKLFMPWYYLIKFILPVVIVLIFIVQLIALKFSLLNAARIFNCNLVVIGY